jgi:paraquat-inducible protein A
MPNPIPTRFAADVPTWLTVLVALLLALSLVLNVIALLPSTAFMEITGALMPGPYSILKVVEMLWGHGLYPLAVLVVCFSVVFPPLKIGLATMAFIRPMTLAGRQRLLGTLGQLGRWSLLDVFVALLLIIITSKQTFTGSTVRWGLYAFLAAIVLSMTSVAIMQEVNRRLHLRTSPPDTHRAKPLVQRSWMAWSALPLLLVAIACLELAVGLPLFQIDKFGLMSNTWSLWSAIGELHDKGLSLFADLMLLFLVIAPAVLVLVAIALLVLPLRRRAQRVLYIAMHNINEWCMLDVFALAMILYLSEERNFAKLNLKSGIWFLFGAMVLFHMVMYLTVWTTKRSLGLDRS